MIIFKRFISLTSVQPKIKDNVSYKYTKLKTNDSLTTINPLLCSSPATAHCNSVFPACNVKTSLRVDSVMRWKTKSFTFWCQKNECSSCYGFYFTSIIHNHANADLWETRFHRVKCLRVNMNMRSNLFYLLATWQRNCCCKNNYLLVKKGDIRLLLNHDMTPEVVYSEKTIVSLTCCYTMSVESDCNDSVPLISKELDVWRGTRTSCLTRWECAPFHF